MAWIRRIRGLAGAWRHGGRPWFGGEGAVWRAWLDGGLPIGSMNCFHLLVNIIYIVHKIDVRFDVLDID